MNESINHSFAVLAYKSSPFLEACIDSLINQHIKSNIYITTSTPSRHISAVAKKYKIPLYINKTGCCISSDWSFAYQQCKTKYVTLAHQDDIYLPEYCQAMLATVLQNEDCIIAFSDYMEEMIEGVDFLKINKKIKKLILFIAFVLRSNLLSSFGKTAMLSFGNPISCSTVLYNKELIGSFKFSKEYQINLDWDAWIRLAKRKGTFCFIRKKLVIHRIHRDAESIKSLSDERREHEDHMIFKELWPKPIADLLSIPYSLSRRKRIC